MQLLRSSEEFKIWHLEHSVSCASSWVFDCFSQTLVLDCLWYFLVFDYTLSSIGSHLTCVKLDLEIVCSAVEDLNRLSIIQFSHTFDFSKHDMISVLVRMPLIFVYCHSWFLVLSDAGDDELLSLFSICIEDRVVSVVYEGVDHRSECFS